MSRLRSLLLVCAAVAVAWGASAAEPKQKTMPNRRAVRRTRETVKMLDDVYKTAVVLITDKYVNDEDDFPAGSAAIALFAAVKEKGWHDVQLIDVSGEPYNDENVADTEFEKEAAKQIKAGKGYYDEVAEKDGKHVLRAATPVPVVMKKCVMCHPHYEDAEKGAAIGMLSYELEIK